MAKKPNVRLIVALILFMGVAFSFYQTEILGQILAPMARLTAQLAVALVHWSGQEAARQATSVSHPGGFAYEINYRCTGFMPLAFLVVSILFCSAPLRKKALGLAVGIPFLVFFNLIRLVHLFYLGVNKSALFHAAHSVVWPAAMILAALSLWFPWLAWARRREGVCPLGRSRGEVVS